jgi:ABC-type transport system involved in multi-copper enzyme maturation permease subunit
VTIRERLAALDRVQRSRMFKIIASVLVVVLSAGAMVAYAVAVQKDRQNAPRVEISGPSQEETDSIKVPEGASEAEHAEIKARQDLIKQERSALEATARSINMILERRSDPTSVAVGILVGAALALAVVWLGLGLTYLGLLAVVGALAGPIWLAPGLRHLVPLVVGVGLLTLAFTSLMRLAHVVLSAPGAVMAIAKNVLAEAVRLKVSLVFILMLIFMLAGLPLLMDESSPLRYRVQTFLQYATGGSFWLIALLVVLFSVATVAFEQRDRVIWQTMTKPVTAAQYVLGKWLGVVTLGAILLAVCGSAIFLFSEYLRSRPALGEESAYVSRSGGLTEDRLILETQVLTARVGREINPPELDNEQFAKNVELRIQAEKESSPYFQDSPATRDKIKKDLYESVLQSYRTIDPGEGRRFIFGGLGEAKRLGTPITFRYKIESGSNRPDITYKVSFIFSGTEPIIKETTLSNTHQMQLSPAIVRDDGTVEVELFNGDINTGQLNERTIHMPPKDGLFMSFQAGSYRANFLRVMIVLWVKLAFLAMLGVAAATFLSFPVACLVSLATFLAAEGAGYLAEAVESYRVEDDKGNLILWRKIAEQVAKAVSDLFSVYADLRPTTKLVDGILMGWDGVALGTTVIALATAVLFVAAVIIFKRRELATYSGH